MANEEAVRCRKCRKILITDLSSLINAHGQKHNGGKVDNDSVITECAISSERSCLYISEESYPQFITDALDESSWTKGKLNCPGCQARIGSFNYISGSHCSCSSHIVPQVHLLISKVDVRRANEALPTPVSYPDRPVVLSTSVIESLLLDNQPDSSSQDCSTSTTLLPTVTGQACNEADDVAAVSLENIEQLESTEQPSSSSLNSPERKKRLSEARRRYIRKHLVNTDDGLVSLESSNKSYNFQVLAPTGEDSEFESEEESQRYEEIPLHLTCSVCLDLLYSPFISHPCKHVFCEPCLRRLARPNPNKTFCPLCRRIIGQCLPSRDLGAEVREKFPVAHQERHEFEQKHNTQHIPLPWVKDFRFDQLNHGGSLVQMAGGWRPILWLLTVNVLGFGGLALLKWYLNVQRSIIEENMERKMEEEDLSWNRWEDLNQD